MWSPSTYRCEREPFVKQQGKAGSNKGVRLKENEKTSSIGTSSNEQIIAEVNEDCGRFQM